MSIALQRPAGGNGFCYPHSSDLSRSALFIEVAKSWLDYGEPRLEAVFLLLKIFKSRHSFGIILWISAISRFAFLSIRKNV